MTSDEIVHILKCQAKSAYHDAKWLSTVQDMTGATDAETNALLEEKLADERRMSFPPRG